MYHARERQGALNDSAATLRQARGVLDDLCETPIGQDLPGGLPPTPAEALPAPCGLPALLEGLDEACGSLQGIIDEFRQGRAEPSASLLPPLLEVRRSLLALGDSVHASTLEARAALRGAADSVLALTRRGEDGPGEVPTAVPAGVPERVVERLLWYLGQLYDQLGLGTAKQVGQPRLQSDVGPAARRSEPADARPSPARGA